MVGRVMRARILIPLLLFAGCTADTVPVEIPFRVQFGDRLIGCEAESPEFTLTDLRFYVSDVRLLDETGTATPLELSVVPQWQSAEVVLLDFENGEGGCANGTAGTHTALRGRIEKAAYTGLSFRIGVPEHLNHGDPLLAEPPLGDTAMHWHWISGYKFLRAGIASDSDGYWLHLGSTRCSGSVTDIEGCRASNRAEARLAGYVPGRDTVIVDLQALVDSVVLDDGVPTDCSSGPTELACARPFAALGIDFESGRSTAPAAIFRVESTQ